MARFFSITVHATLHAYRLFQPMQSVEFVAGPTGAVLLVCEDTARLGLGEEVRACRGASVSVSASPGLAGATAAWH